jgi:hypothetical protein
MGRFFAASTRRMVMLALCLVAGPALAQTGTAPEANSVIDLSIAHGAGTPGTTDTVVIENIRSLLYRAVALGAGRFGWGTDESTYNITYRFDPATLRLVPDTYTRVSGPVGGTGCATLNVTIVNSVVGTTAPIAGATIAIQSQTAQTDAAGRATVTGLPSGQSTLIASATGFGTIMQTVDLTCAEANEIGVALSPGSGSAGALRPGQFRVVLTWGRNPSDLDSHLTGPVSDPTSRFHLAYYAPTDGGVCGLDVDDTSSYGPETVTCPMTSSSTGEVLPGLYRYGVHHFSGSGNIGTSGAIVRLEQGDGTTQYFFPPSTGWTGNTLWTVFEITVAADGTTSVTTVNSASAGSLP